MRIAICDDVPEFANELSRLIHDVCANKDWTLQYQIFLNPQKLLEEDLSNINAVFLDIDMPEINGMDVAHQLRSQYPDLIIVFVTGWIEYAPAGYHVNAFRYLLKSNIHEVIGPCIEDIHQKLYNDSASIRISFRDGDSVYALKDIAYFEGTSRRVVLMHTSNSNAAPLECLGKLADYDDRLKDKGFLRIQKSFLVNMKHIVKIRNYSAFLRNGTTLKVSEKNYPQICHQYIIWKGQQL